MARRNTGATEDETPSVDETPIAETEKVEEAEHPVAADYVRIRFMDLDERVSYGVSDVPLVNREFRLAHDGKLYEQGRLTGDGSWIYHDRGL